MTILRESWHEITWNVWTNKKAAHGRPLLGMDVRLLVEGVARASKESFNITSCETAELLLWFLALLALGVFLKGCA